MCPKVRRPALCDDQNTGGEPVGPAAAAALLGPLLERPLTVVDAGARWGVPSAWQWFGSHAQVFGFEPDVEEAARLGEQYAGDPSTHIFPVALGRAPGAVPLYVTQDASGSSFFPPIDMPRHRHTVGDRVRTVIDVDTTSLDVWLETAGCGPVDAIKLDVQGAELEILQGARTALAGTRMILAEVHLNEMYEGAPLFGEVDAYLRGQGFELWRFPVVAHYAAGLTRTDIVDRVDVHWYSSWPAPLAAGPGQAIWADALYVKRDLAAPDAVSDPVRLVRDAAVAIGMDEPELASNGLVLALPQAPADWRPRLRSALGALRHRSPTKAYETSRRRHLADTAHVLDRPVDVDLALPITGWGWHDPEPVAGDRYLRWTGPQREAAIDLALRLLPGTAVCVEVAGAADPELLQTLAVEVDGRELAVVAEWGEAGLRYRACTGERWDRGYTRLLLRTGRTVPWEELHPGSGDTTEYGVAVSGISLVPPSVDGPPAGEDSL
jgi:FkbM family methyltransferase